MTSAPWRQSTLTRIFAPRRWLRDRLTELEVRAPRVDWQAIHKRLPWNEYGRLAKRIAPPVSRGSDDPFYRFGAFVDEDRLPQIRRLDIRDMYGICASKSHIVPLSELSQKSSISRILAERDVGALVQEVLHGSIDYVARAGQPVDVLEQTWDGRLYVSNSGGSHRFAAIWRFHREQRQPLIMDCAVRTASLAASTVEAVAAHRYWLLVLERAMDADHILSIAGDRSLVPEYGFGQLGGIPLGS